MPRGRRGNWVRRAALAAILLVTSWSVWAWAQHREPPRHEGAETAESAEHAEHEGPAPINWTDFGNKETPPYVAMLVNFGILVFAYVALGKKPIAAALQARRDSIAKEIDEANKMRAEAEARAKTYQAKLEKVEQEVATARDALVRAGEAERDRIVSEAEAKGARMRRDAQFMVEQERKQMRQDLWRDAVETAVTAAEELLKKRVTQADQERLADDYLADLGGRPKSMPPPAAGPRQTGEPA